MKQSKQGELAAQASRPEDLDTIDRVVPMSFKEFLVAMVHDDEAAAQLANEIGLRRE